MGVSIGYFLLSVDLENSGGDEVQIGFCLRGDGRKDTYNELIIQNYKVYAMPLPQKLEFCW
ncbi:MAG: hypothetical protein H6599_10595 [Flavobacteriales bacterium]|nr:hypothetical protein [Flavobacteriales bacterium]